MMKSLGSHEAAELYCLSLLPCEVLRPINRKLILRQAQRLGDTHGRCAGEDFGQFARAQVAIPH